MVYRGGLENRFGLTPNGGSNPSLSAKEIVNSLTKTLIWVGVLGVIFAVLWWQGQLKRLSAYFDETKEELKKCTWPTWTELKGSTVIVMVSILLIGLFTAVVDYVLANVFTRL